MERNKIWIHYLIIGISILSSGCTRSTDAEPVIMVSFAFRNNTTNALDMAIYNEKNDLIKSFFIPSDSQLTTNTTLSMALQVFYFDSREDSVGSSVLVKFSDQKCLYYAKGHGTGLFDLRRYTKHAHSSGVGEVYLFTFNTEHYNSAEICM